MRSPLALTPLVLVLALAVAGCGGSDADLTVYSGRAERLVGELIEQFERDTGLEVDVRYGESAELAATIAEEGRDTPADVFFAQDAGALGAVAAEGLFKPLPALPAVPGRFKDPGGRWVGTSGRARVVAYSTERIDESELPDSIFDFTDPRWKGRIGFPPPNASFQAFISAMRLSAGDARTRAWLEGIKANDPELLENNIQTEEAIAAGEIDVGFVNHYYVYELRKEKGEFPVANHFLRDGDPGSLVNVAGAGIIESTPAARRFVQYLLSRKGQSYFADETFEYPLVEGVAPPSGLPPLDEVEGPGFDLGKLGSALRPTLELLEDAGLSG